MKKYIPFIIICLLFLFVLIVNDAGLFYVYQKKMNQSIQSYDDKVSALQRQISGLQTKLTLVSEESAHAALSAKEIANRQMVAQKSQTQSVTDAVSKVVPAVVSVIITKNVPQYQIVYENPFGDDPFFQNFGMQIPVYKPTGQTVPQKVGAGTGFFITSNGYILTNKHVVSDGQASYTVLLSDGKQQIAKVIYRDTQNDIAVIKIDGSNYPVVKLGDSNTVQLGQTVIAVGNALGQYNNSVSMGVISGLNRTIQASNSNGSIEELSGVIQTDAAINSGNSGGPLVDLSGNAIGVNVATAQSASNISFSIPINTIKNVIKNVVSGI